MTDKTLPVALREAADLIERRSRAEGIDWQAKHASAWQRLQQIYEALDGGPLAVCRDCADGDGTCPMDGLPCDPQARALEQIRRLRAQS